MTQSTKINDTGARALALAMLVQAARDASAGDEDAIAWLIDKETEDFWGTLAGINWRIVLAWVDAGCKLQRGGRRGEKQKKFETARKYMFMKMARSRMQKQATG